MCNKIYVLSLIVFLVVFSLSTSTLAGSLPDTGQTQCYDNDSAITCPSPGEPFYGQDANYAPCNPHSYTTLGGGTMVQDNVTGLIWEIKQDKDSMPDYENPHDADNTYTWYDGDTGIPGDGIGTFDTLQHFIDELNTAGFGGHNDWRMPTAKELSTIVDSSIPFPGPVINTDYYPNTVPSDYWSSSVFSSSSNQALYVSFSAGGVLFDGKSHNYYVRAVCGTILTQNLVNHGNGTVTDTITGLMWEVKESKDDTPDYENPHDADNTYTWEDALSLCENLTLAGYNDWRLPNRNELQSLVDYSQHDPSIDTTFFPNTVSFDYWASTIYASDPGRARNVHFYFGGVIAPYKWDNYYVRAVRGGQCESQAIPTLTEWGIIIFMTLMMGIGVVFLYRRRIV